MTLCLKLLTVSEYCFTDIDQLNNLANPRRFKNLLLRGKYKSYENTVSLCGASNVGKSTLASIMIGDELPLTWKSTDGLNIHFGRNGIDLDKQTMIPLKEGKHHI